MEGNIHKNCNIWAVVALSWASILIPHCLDGRLWGSASCLCYTWLLLIIMHALQKVEDIVSSYKYNLIAWWTISSRMDIRLTIYGFWFNCHSNLNGTMFRITCCRIESSDLATSTWIWWHQLVWCHGSNSNSNSIYLTSNILQYASNKKSVFIIRRLN